MPQLLVELFSEEIPARMQPGAARDFERMARDRLAEAGLAFESILTWSGPRRLTLVVEGLPAAQADRVEERKGPRVGAPDAAIDGFLRSAGVARQDLVERDGVYFATLSRTGRPTGEIAAEMVEQIVRNFPWPKSMTWGRGTLRWVRPLRGIVCLFDGQVVPLEIDGVVAGDTVQGHRFMGSGRAFKVRDANSYVDGLAKHYVIVDAQDRAETIIKRARDLCLRHDLELVEDDGLLAEVSGLAEWPTPILGDMDPAFLDLPPEVIRTSMRTHQKYFAVKSRATGKLAPHFLVVANIEAQDGGKLVAAGNARVLSARLNDARFFWDEDRRAGFNIWLEKLKGVTFHARLGTMAERVARLELLAEGLAETVGADSGRAREAARLSKADLASNMVGEFPELQGLMGGYYARADGMSPLIAEAIEDHYKPAGPNDDVPDRPVAMAVALADKVDTLAGFFAIGEKPTGSRDPYALRRAALGLIRILLKSEIRAPVRDLVGQWYDTLTTYAAPGRAVYVSAGRVTAWLGAERMTAPEVFEPYLREFRDALKAEPVYVVKMDNDVDIEFDRASAAARPPEQPVLLEFRGYTEVVEEIAGFLADRLKVLLRDQGRRHDLVDAVFALGDDDLVRIVARVEALSAFLATEDGANLLAGYKRAANILGAEAKKGALPTGEARERAGAPAEELALIRAVEGVSGAVDAALAKEDFGAAMTALAGLRAPVDAFFEAVLVNSDNPEERANRLRLLVQVRDAMGQVADFSQVSG
ncbi:MAG: glycine--tRNA ligase subunit beta [Proteobacteria bacterium]|nr:glycine--tRNA ligase subunit beta [Pseudomonadota bacterium]